ncbi:hypothetical protein D3C75_966030 [compost metagenome]
MTAQGVHAAACHPHVAEQQLNHRHGANVLRAHGVLRPAQRVQERRGFIFYAGRCDVFTDLDEVIFRGAANIGNHFRRVARNVLFEQVPHATWMSQRQVAFGEAFFVQLIVPGGFVVFTIYRVIARKQAVIEAVILTHNQIGVGVSLNVFTVVFIVIDQVQQHARQESDV